MRKFRLGKQVAALWTAVSVCSTGIVCGGGYYKSSKS